jgi:hypothetical protein
MSKSITGMTLWVVCGLWACSAQAVDNRWYEASFSAQFPPREDPVGSVTLYQQNSLSGENLTNAFKNVPDNQRKALVEASNPLHALYPKLYTSAALSKRAACPVLAATIELDDNTQTKEQVVAMSTTRCLDYDEAQRLRSGDTEPHLWVVQQGTDGQYRILAEGDGTLSINRSYRQNGYKTIRTHASIRHLFPDDPLQCGGAELTWHYQNGQYQLADTDYQAQDCEPLYFPDAKGAEWDAAYQRYVQQVKPLIDKWLTQNPTAQAK